MCRCAIAVLVAATLWDAVELPAQRGDSLRVGVTVRVERRSPNPQLIRGTYVTHDSLSFVITPGRARYLMSIPVKDISAVEIPAGIRPLGESMRRGAGRGALVGLGVGALVVTVVAISERGRQSTGWYPPQVVAGAFAVVSTVAGTVVGAVAGMAGRERWTEVPFRQ